MNNEFVPPVIGSWYHEQTQNHYFEVVAIDSASGTIEIQYLDGELGEFEQDSWQQLALSFSHPPEDAGAAFELSLEDQWNDDSAMLPHSMSNPLNHIEPDFFPGFDDF